MTVRNDLCSGLGRRLTILGSTGSVGQTTIELIELDRASYHVEALTANNNAVLLAEQAHRLGARFVAIANPEKYKELKSELNVPGVEVAAGAEAIVEAAGRDVDWVMAAIVGAAGLEPTLEAVKQASVVALANKECLVCAGDLMINQVSASGCTLLPVDSEHNAIFQVFNFERLHEIEKIILTASGGPFRSWTYEEMRDATPVEAIAHPNWDMGAKISVDSATMMNKGLELIEAHFLFGLPEEKIDIILHPQSIIHSMVAYVDGSVLAQLASPDMSIPVSYALAWPHRMVVPRSQLNLCEISTLTFERPDSKKFPALHLAREALKAGGSAPTILNAANEEAVAAFLEKEIGFLDISRIVTETLNGVSSIDLVTVDDVISVDNVARQFAQKMVQNARLQL